MEGGGHGAVAGAPARRHHGRPARCGHASPIELGYAIEPDPGPSGRLGHWKISGVPDEVMEVHSKRAAEIEAECRRRGDSSYRARGVAARTTRKAKRHEADRAAGRTLASGAGLGRMAGRAPCRRLIDAAAAATKPARMSFEDARRLIAEVLAPDGELARRKVFSRRQVIVELAPHLYGQDPKLLEPLVERALADPEAVPIIGVAGARERVYSLASVLAQERAIAESLGRQLARSDAPSVEPVQRRDGSEQGGGGYWVGRSARASALLPKPSVPQGEGRSLS